MATPEPRQLPMTDEDRKFLPPAVAAAAARANELMGVAAVPPVTPPGNPPPAPPATVTPPETPPPEPTEEEIEAFLAHPSDAGSDLARLQHALRSERGRVKTLKRQLDSAGRTPAPLPQVAPLLAPVRDVPDLQLSQEDVDTYGADLINIMSQVANHAAAKTRASIMKEVAPALQGVATMTVQQLQEQARATVNAAIAPWGTTFDAIDNDPNFLSWLKLTDRMSGATRNELFLRAWHHGNPDSLIAIMTAYLSEVAPTAAQPTPTQPAGNPPAGRTVVPLTALAAPGRAPNPAPLPSTQGTAKPVYTRADVKKFYDDKRRGAFTGHDQEVADTEREIHLASMEGRII